MSDFTFPCPSCQQQIQASSEHSGLEVDCPLCQAKIVIPPAPGATEPEKPKGKLHMAASTTEHKPQSFAQAPAPPRKKKRKIEPSTIAGIAIAIIVVIAGVMFGPKLYDAYKQKQADKEAAEVAAATPPPPPPEPTAAEIIHKVGEKYKSLSTYAAAGKTTADLDLSALAPGNPAYKSVNLTADTGIRLARPSLYRLEWALQTGASTTKGAAWSAGKGDFVAAGAYPAKARNRATALSQASGSSGTLGVVLADMFFDDSDNPATAALDFSKTNAQNLNGQDCYVLTGDEKGVKLELWVSKKDFLINQTEIFLTGTLDDAAYKAQTNTIIKAQMMRASKIRGTITETYHDIAVNKPLAAADFDTAIAAKP